MDKRNRKAFLVLLFTLVVSDICSFIRFFIEYKNAVLYNFSIFVCKYSYNGSIIKVYNIAACYFVISASIFFIINLFKDKKD